MKKLLTILGTIFAVILVVLIIAAAIFIPRALKLDHEAIAYIQDTVPKIVDHWDPQALTALATPELLADIHHADDITRLFVMFRQLGILKHLDTPKGSVYSGAYTGTGSRTVGNYSIQAQFEHGDAAISIQLLRVDGVWKINGFRINSDAFLPPKTTP